MGWQGSVDHTVAQWKGIEGRTRASKTQPRHNYKSFTAHHGLVGGKGGGMLGVGEEEGRQVEGMLGRAGRQWWQRKGRKKKRW